MKSQCTGFSLLETVWTLAIFSSALLIILKLSDLKRQQERLLHDQQQGFAYLEAFRWFLKKQAIIDGDWWAYWNASTCKRSFKPYEAEGAFFLFSVKSDEEHPDVHAIKQYALPDRRLISTFFLFRERDSLNERNL